MDIATILKAVGGFILLVGGAELLVRGAASLASRFSIPPLVIGLTVVAFGTSAPELAVSVKAGLAGQGDLALGNIVGSNILNVLLILGLSALITPLLVDSKLIRRDVPLLIIASIALLIMALDGAVGRVDGLLLFSAVVLYTISAIRAGRRQSADTLGDEAGSLPDLTPGLAVLALLSGLALLVLGADWLVDSAVALARWLGVSELLIGLTVVAIGTSLPEIATSLVAALKGMRDMAVGNVIGSCLFNILAVCGVAAMVAPGGLEAASALLRFDLPIMIATALACLPIFATGHLIARWEGALFFGYYLAYTTWLILSAGQHDALGVMSVAMLGFVLPLTVITLAVLWLREWRARTRTA